MRQAGLFTLSLCLMMGYLALNWVVWGQNTDNSNDGGMEIISSFASGDRFFLDKNSFQPLGNGKLQYQVIGVTGQQNPDNPTYRVSRNEVNCGTGQLQSPVQSWTQDSRGESSNPLPGPVGPTKLTNRGKIYGLLKDACQQYAPEAKQNW